MAWEENSRICLHMQLIAILSRIGVYFKASAPFRACGEKLAKLELQRNPQSFIYAKKIRDNTLLTIK